MILPQKPQRNFLPQTLHITSWESISSYFDSLKNREINNANDLIKWLKDWSELEAVLEEDMAWRYIKMSINTTDENLRKSFEFFVEEIEPKIAPYQNQFEKMWVNSPFLNQINPETFKIPLRKAQKNIEIYREENIPLFTKLHTLSQKFGLISGKMTIEVNGEEITMQKAASFLKQTDRSFRKEVYEKIQKVRFASANELDELFSQLISLRHQVAQNAGFSNYRDYMFAAMGRFDYTPNDCFNFHDAVENELVPLINKLALQRKEKLKLNQLKPFDLAVDVEGRTPLKPFENANELINKTIAAFNKLDLFFGDCIKTMDKMGHLDLESKKGKAPGGYNYPLYEIGVPFIFMNAVGTVRDLVTMVHEGGHAIHSFLSKDLPYTSLKNLTSEVAELASMSMELLSMPYWDSFFDKKEDLKRAQLEHLQDVLETLPWIALIDKFQHWIYENPNHTINERHQHWLQLHKRFSPNSIDYSGYEDFRKTIWQKQLHLFEVPFYYIEYGMAQLGAIAVYRNFKQNGTNAIIKYKNALSLGYSKPITSIYEAAGINFNFSQENISQLVSFIENEINQIQTN